MSVALEICRMAEERLGRDRLPDVVAVGLDIGDGSGIEVDNLTFCLEALLSSPPFRRARPVVTRKAGDELNLSWLEVDDDRPDD